MPFLTPRAFRLKDLQSHAGMLRRKHEKVVREKQRNEQKALKEQQKTFEQQQKMQANIQNQQETAQKQLNQFRQQSMNNVNFYRNVPGAQFPTNVNRENELVEKATGNTQPKTANLNTPSTQNAFVNNWANKVSPGAITNMKPTPAPTLKQTILKPGFRWAQPTDPQKQKQIVNDLDLKRRTQAMSSKIPTSQKMMGFLLPMVGGLFPQLGFKTPAQIAAQRRTPIRRSNAQVESPDRYLNEFLASQKQQVNPFTQRRSI